MKSIACPSFAGLLFALLSLVVGTGCKSGPQPPKPGPSYSYSVELDKSLEDQDFTVDVVPVNSSNKDRILGMSIDDYFNNKDQIRTGVQKIDSKALNKATPKFTIDLESPQWKAYRYPSFSHIAFIADSKVRGTVGGKDQRRIVVPLDPAQWQDKWPTKKREISVRYSSAGVETSPGPLSVP